MAEALNQQLDPLGKPFRTVMNFELVPAGNTVATATNDRGPYALVEYTSALPRAKLYTQWQVVSGEQATLARLAAQSFVPSQTVLVNEPIPPPSSTAGPAEGTVEFVSYAPKRIELAVEATAPSVLLLNDRWDADWRVWIDNAPARVLTCNAIMRGVQVPPGRHTVSWRFQPPLGRFTVSCAGMALGIVCFGLLVVVRQEDREPPSVSRGV
jgi:hypothetical protein